MKLHGYIGPPLLIAAVLFGIVNPPEPGGWVDGLGRTSADTTYKTNLRFVYVTDTTLWVYSGPPADTSMVPDTSAIAPNSFLGITRRRSAGGGKMMVISPEEIAGVTALDSAAADDSASLYGMTAGYLQVVALGPPSGDPTPLGVPGNWTLVLNDEFLTMDTINTWTLGPPWHPQAINDQDQYYVTEYGNTVVVDGGKLHLIVKDSVANGYNYQSGSVSSHEKVYQKYGFFEIKLKPPSSQPGLWPEVWLMGHDPGEVGLWPGAGEFDFLEQPYAPTRAFMGHHWSDGGNQAKSVVWQGGEDYSDDYHVWGLYWDADKMIGYLDGQPMLIDYDADAVTDSAMHWIIDVALCEDEVDSCWGDPVTGSTLFPDTMSIEYVRVWTGTADALPVYVDLDAEDGSLFAWEAVDTVGGNTLEVTTEEAYEGSRSWKISFSGDSANANAVRGAGASDDSVWASFAFFVDATYAAPIWTSLEIASLNTRNTSQGDGVPLTKFFLGQQGAGTFLLYAHRWSPTYMPGFPETTLIASVSTDTWYEIHTLWNVTNGDSTVLYYVDSTLVATVNDTTLDGDKLDKIWIGGTRGGPIPTAGHIYADEVKIDPDLEP